MAASLKNITSGASTGATLGTAIAPGIGTAIGAGLGAAGAAVAGAVGGGNSLERYVKNKFKEFNEKGTTVSDAERQGIGEALTEAQGQTQAAQEIARQRNSMAMTGGSPIMAGQQKQTAKELGEANRSTAVKADTQARRMALAIDERRQNELMQRMREIEQKSAENENTGLALADAAAEIVKLV